MEGNFSKEPWRAHAPASSLSSQAQAHAQNDEALINAAVEADRVDEGVHTQYDAWRSLLRGELRLVQCFERDGRRFLVARREPSERRVPLFSPREEQALALRARGLDLERIAEELEISASSASRAIHAGLAKLGLTTVGDLACFAEW